MHHLLKGSFQPCWHSQADGAQSKYTERSGQDLRAEIDTSHMCTRQPVFCFSNLLIKGPFCIAARTLPQKKDAFLFGSVEPACTRSKNPATKEEGSKTQGSDAFAGTIPFHREHIRFAVHPHCTDYHLPSIANNIFIKHCF